MHTYVIHMITYFSKDYNACDGKHNIFLISPVGGVVTAGLAIYDTMQYILNPISTWCVGQAASMGSLLLAAGTAGMRHSLPNARIMVHQLSGGARVRKNYRIYTVFLLKVFGSILNISY